MENLDAGWLIVLLLATAICFCLFLLVRKCVRAFVSGSRGKDNRAYTETVAKEKGEG